MGTNVLARKRNETFDVIEERKSVPTEPASRRTASDEEADTAFSYAISKHKKALEELAKYDRG